MKGASIVWAVVLASIAWGCSLLDGSDGEGYMLFHAKSPLCDAVEEGDWKAVGGELDEILRVASEEETDFARLERFACLLKRHSCVEAVEVLCVSCVKTRPPQSHVAVRFVSMGGGSVDTVLDIRMSAPMCVVGMH